METSLSISTILSLLSIIAVTITTKVVNWVWLMPKKLEKWLRQQGIKGTSYKLFYGDMKEYSFMSTQALKTPLKSFHNNYYPRIEPFRYKLISQFGGKVYFFWSGPTPVINILRPDMIREALTKTDDIWKPKLNPIIDKLFPGLINYEGEEWALRRKLINPAFHTEKIRFMLPAFYESSVLMISKWEKILDEKGSSEIDLWPYLCTLTADVISRAAFGSSYEEGRKIFELLKEQINMVLATLQSVYIPGFKYIPTAKNRRFKEFHNQIQTLLKRIINKRQQEIEAGESVKADLLGILLDSNLKETEKKAVSGVKNKPLGMSLEEVIGECKLFYLAGQETTSVLLVWTLLLLSKHQDWQAQAREEVLRIFGSNVPDYEGLNHLKTMTMIIYEVLRLYPPAIQLNRRINKDTKLGELSLPSGALIALPLLLVHQDKEFWGDDVEDFKPERFSEGILKATSRNNTFFPFGCGPRTCIGEKFALNEAKMALSMILQRFSFELSPNYTHAPLPVLFLQPNMELRLFYAEFEVK